MKIKDLDFDNPQFSLGALSSSQLIWPNTTEAPRRRVKPSSQSRHPFLYLRLRAITTLNMRPPA